MKKSFNTMLLILLLPLIGFTQSLSVTEVIKLKNSNLKYIDSLMDIKKIEFLGLETAILSVDNNKQPVLISDTSNNDIDYIYKSYYYSDLNNFLNFKINKGQRTPFKIIYRTDIKLLPSFKALLIGSGFKNSSTYSKISDIISIYENINMKGLVIQLINKLNPESTNEIISRQLELVIFNIND